MIINKIEEDVYSFEDFKESDLKFKNFSSKRVGKYDSLYPNFWIYIPEELADEFKNKNVNVRMVEPYKPEETVKYRVNVKINFDYFKKPEVYIRLKGNEKEYLNEDTVYTLDSKEITYGEMLVKINYNSGDGEYNGLYANILGVKVRENAIDAKFEIEEYPIDE